MELLRIAELEESCGFPRSAIYHCQRMGLLPPVHRSGGSPAVYGQKHLQALLKIRELKVEGLSIKEIRRQLDALGSNVEAESPDLAARHPEATRRRIRETAAREFAAIESSAMRPSWDRDFSTTDYLWTNLEVFLAIRAVYLGPADIRNESREYAEFILDLDAHPPFSFAVSKG